MNAERISMLKGKRNLLLEQRQTLLSRYDNVTAAIDVAERAKPYFVALKDATDQGAVKLYSELLTSIVHDVMQDYEQKILLTTGVVRNKTTLDIKTVKHGEVESIDEGRGGSISNLISAGLRFISLYKSTNRRFIILDEPECWLAPDLIPRFVSVIERMSDLIGIQTVLISHHASDVISSDNSEVITIAYDKSDKLHAIVNAKTTIAPKLSVSEVKFDSAREETLEALSAGIEVGIDYIRLNNIQSHSDTVVKLGKGLTVINGNNDIGKSVIARSFAAMMTNDFKDQLIRHGEEAGFLEVMTEQGIIKWSFKRKAKTSLYQFIVDGTIMHEEDAKKGELPTFLNDVMAMPLVNGINIHIADQRDPLFILHPSHSPADRAEMLNLGDSFKQLQIMMQLHDEQLRENRRALKATKEQVDELNDKLFYLSSLDSINDLQNELSECEIVDVTQYDSTIRTIESASIADQYENVIAMMNELLIDYDSEDTHNALIQALETEALLDSDTLLKLNELLTNLDAIELYDEHNDLLSQLQAASIGDQSALIERVSLCLNNLTFINTRDLPDFDMNSFSRNLEQQYNQEREIAQLEAELAKLLELQTKIQVCPTCGQKVGQHHDSHDVDFNDFEMNGVLGEFEKSRQNDSFNVTF